MMFAEQNIDGGEENRKRELGPREHAGMPEHGEAEGGATATSERLADSLTPHMNPKTLLYFHFGFLVLIGAGIIALFMIPSAPQEQPTAPNATSTQVSAAASAIATSTATSSEATAPKKTVQVGTTTSAAVKKTSSRATESVPASQGSQVSRIQNPYTTPPLTFPAINDIARESIVNILCTTNGGSLRPISGTGVMIDPKGIILTNAHVAQYVLLSQSPQVNISCTIRTGNPATARYVPRVLYMPRIWVEEHAKDIKSTRPLGTGEHDYALLYAAAAIGANTLPSSFPSLSVDTREAIGFIGDQTLVASYPAEFLGGSATYNSLYPSTSITTIGQLLTFHARTVDVISLGGIIQAQSGSSGGAAVNAWGKMIGLITTTSEGSTTGERDLRAITLSYIDRDIQAQTGKDLETTLAGDPAAQSIAFAQNDGLALVKLLVAAIVQ